ncbi:MAG TPA: XRE family transcriptional regulator [Armatimonadota bacterium]|jgi:Zn-dependent peptidase ImmA (M78 family)/DNA-binding XRE family transcriptional regulator
MVTPFEDVDPRALGLRIQGARKARGVSQMQAAQALGMSRPTYIAIEKGERRVSPEELTVLSELVGRTVHELLRKRPPVSNLVPHFRTAASRFQLDDSELDASTAQLQELCDDYLELESLCRTTLTRNYPAPYVIGSREAREAASEAADTERRRLGLGDGPIASLRQILEADVGLRVFNLRLPNEVAGLFAYDEALGGCIAVQGAHPVERQEWSLAHEYAHFLAHRFEPEVTVLRSGSRSSAKERFADAFAECFLMPEYGLRRRFNDLRQASENVTVGGLVTLADLYGVSFQAMVLRLETLRLTPGGTWEGLKKRGFKVREAKEQMGLEPPAPAKNLPDRYVSLAAQAFEEDLITEGELMRFLRTDRQFARQLVQNVLHRTDVTRDGETRQLVLDLSEPVTP